ncbi:MAG: hypothetical protein HY708_07625 [Ignavibacteriae bacterium]|nr:hypothetical protein [Ignavibacteriota bacterium]
MKKILKILLYSVGGVVLLALLAAGMTQTQFFRDRLRAFALSTIDSLLEAEVSLGEIEGNLVTGFTIDSISVKVGDDYLLTADRLDIRYDLFEIPSKRVTIGAVTLFRPTVRLLCGTDGIWNYQRMMRTTSVDTTEGEPFDWPIVIRRLEIKDGTIALIDSAALAESDHPPPDPYFVEYHNFSLRQVNLVTSASITPDEKSASIEALSFVSDQPEIRVSKFEGNFLVTNNEARVKDLVIKTDRSDLRLNASMKDVDLLGGIDLEQFQRNPVEVGLHTHDMDLGELKRFIHQIDFLDGKVALDLEADGDFGELRLDKLDLKMGRSEIYFKGLVANLHTPGDLYLSVKCTESKVFPPDAMAILSGLDLPRFDSLGLSTLNLEYEGTPLNFHTKFLLETASGNVHADASLKIGGSETLTYDAEFFLKGFNIARVVESTSLESNLNGIVKVKGAGVTLDNLSATLAVDVDSSEFLGDRVGKTQVLIEALNRKLNTTLIVSMGTMRSVLTAEIDRAGKEDPTFRLEGNVSSLNLQKLFRDESQNSDLTFNINAQGVGLEWGKLNGDFALDFLPSRYREYQLTAGTVHLFIDQHDPIHKEIKLESNIADFSLSGVFDLEYMGGLITYQLQNLRMALSEKFRTLDSTLTTNVDLKEFSRQGKKLAAESTVLDARYSLELKDLEPISVVTGNRTFNGIGVLTGAIKGNYQNLMLSGELKLDDFFYGTADSGVLIQGGIATFDVNNLEPVNPLKPLDVRLVTSAAKMHVNRDELDSLRVAFTYQQEYSSYTFRTAYGDDVRLVLQGLASVSEDAVVFTLNDFRIAYKDVAWTADGGSTVGFGRHSLRIRDVIMRRDSQTVSIAGSLDIEGMLDARISAMNLDLADLKYLIAPEELGVRAKAFEGRAQIEINAGGTLQEPTYDVTVQAADVAYRSVPFGRVHGDFHYKSEALVSHVVIDNRLDVTKGTPALTIDGTLPVNLAFGEVDQRLPERPLDFSVQSDGIAMGLLDPLLPTFNDLRGILTSSLKVIGTPQRPSFHGAIAIDSCSFLFVPNNIYYTFDGLFQPDGERIRVYNATIKNIPSDNRLGREGVMQMRGDFTLRGFKPTDFNLNAFGQLLVVGASTRRSSLSVYGDLFVEIGPEGLHYTGTIDHSLLKGRVVLRNSNLIFPPTEGSTQLEQPFSIPVAVVDDTTKLVEQHTSTLSVRYFGYGAESGELERNKADLPTTSFLDGLRYDLDIESSGGNTEIRMIFNTATNEELVANIDGTFSITEDGKQWVGTLTVGRAYYNFYGKRFDAEGTLSYSGDFLNPELNIKGHYQGTRVVADTAAQRTEKVVVNLTITGTRLEPKLEITMTIDDVDYYSYSAGPTSGDVQSDAVTFILTGDFPLTRGQRNDLASEVGATVGGSLLGGATSLLTNVLSDFLRYRTGFITSVELSYGRQGSFGQSADIRVSGVAFNGLWRYGGKILEDPVSNANISLLYSFGDILGNSSLRNFMFELERKVDFGTTGAINDRKDIHSARLFYRISF